MDVNSTELLKKLFADNALIRFEASTPVGNGKRDIAYAVASDGKPTSLANFGADAGLYELPIPTLRDFIAANFLRALPPLEPGILLYELTADGRKAAGI